MSPCIPQVSRNGGRAERSMALILVKMSVPVSVAVRRALVDTGEQRSPK